MMSTTRDWLPTRRADILAMCRTWITVFTEDTTDDEGATVKKYAAWGIPQDTITDLGARYSAAETALEKAQEKETGQKPEAFGSEFAA